MKNPQSVYSSIGRTIINNKEDMYRMSLPHHMGSLGFANIFSVFVGIGKASHIFENGHDHTCLDVALGLSSSFIDGRLVLLNFANPRESQIMPWLG